MLRSKAFLLFIVLLLCLIACFPSFKMNHYSTTCIWRTSDLAPTTGIKSAVSSIPSAALSQQPSTSLSPQNLANFLSDTKTNLYFVGLIGSGKTSMGSDVAKMWNMPHVDIDDMFENSVRMSVLDYGQKYGWGACRTIEHNLLRYISSFSGIVVSTGGDVIANDDNLPLLKKGLVVYLQEDPGSLGYRLQHSDASRRPLLVSPTWREDLYRLHNERHEKFISIADIVVDGAGNLRESRSQKRKRVIALLNNKLSAYSGSFV